MVNTTRAIFRTQSNIYDGAFFVKIVNGSLPLTPSTPPNHFCMSIMRILLNARIIHYPRYNMNNKIKTCSMHCSLQLFLYILLLAFRTVLDTVFFLNITGPPNQLYKTGKVKTTLREKCPNTEVFLVRISLYSVRMQENTDQKYLDTFHVVQKCTFSSCSYLKVY